jgi:glutamate-1-semialdehyde 2,1-aminomutase
MEPLGAAASNHLRQAAGAVDSIDRMPFAEPPPLHADRLRQALQDEQARFSERHPISAALQARTDAHYLFGMPMHWMRDWPNPHGLFIAQAQGSRLRCVDGLDYADFCLGDTGAMFGHSPPVVAEAIATQARHGLTCMLPSDAAAEVGERRSGR